MTSGSWLRQDWRSEKGPALSLRIYLATLVLALVVPGLCFTGYILVRFAAAERARIEKQVDDEAQMLSAAIDRRIGGLMGALRVLATSNELDERDIQRFYRRAAEARAIVGRNIVLRSLDGQQLVNARVSEGEPLPTVNLPADERVKEEKRTVVSGVFNSPITGEGMIAIISPVRRNGEVRYLLSLSIDLVDLQAVFKEVGAPPGHAGAIFDAHGVLIARSGSRGDRAEDTRSPETQSGLDVDAAPVLTAWSRSELTGWTVMASAPRSAIDTPVLAAWSTLAALGAATLLISLALAGLLGNRISGALRILAATGLELGARRRVPMIRTPLAEANEIGAALREASERLQDYEIRLEKALSVARMFSFEWLMQNDAIQRSASADQLLGCPPGDGRDGSRASFAARVHPEDLPRLSRITETLRPDKPTYRIEYRYLRPDGEVVWFQTSGYGEFGPSGEVLRVNGFTADVTERKKAEIRQALLVRELHHRVKNNLATVLAVINLSGRNAQGLDDYKRKLRERIQSMARSHTLLTESAFQQASLRKVLLNEIEAYSEASGERVRLDGPDVELPAECAAGLGMVFHELATNAGKYGSLSKLDGRLHVRWAVEEGPGERSLVLKWRETDGPPVTPPERTGFGSRLLSNIIEGQLRGRIDMRFEPEGLVVDVTTPIGRAGRRAEPDAFELDSM